MLDLNKIIKIQKELDTLIENKFEKTKMELLEERCISLQVELFEFINETKCFKFWSSNKDNINKDKLIEEYVDVLHFLLSIGITLGKEDWIYKYEKSEINILWKINEASRLINDLFVKPTIKTLDRIIYCYIEIGNYFNININDIIDMYCKKNKINFERQENNY